MIRLLRLILLQAFLGNRYTIMMSSFSWNAVLTNLCRHPSRANWITNSEKSAARCCSFLPKMHQQFLLRTNTNFFRKFTTIHCCEAATSYQPHTGKASDSMNVREKNTPNNVTQFLSQLSTTLHQTILPQIFHFSALRTKIDQPLVIVLGVSGGSDSVALLHGLLQLSSIDGSAFPSNPYPYRTLTSQILSPEYQQSCIPIALHVVHFDHQQRGKDSDQDREFVQDLCQQNHVPFHCYYWNDHTNTDDGINKCNSKTFTQDLAREWRRSTMIQLLHQLITNEDNSFSEGKDSSQAPEKGPNEISKLGVIMTAHHLDDSEETILLKLLRGVHISRLQGIEAVSTSFFSQYRVLFARPLIQLRKEEIKAFLMANQLHWREDSSNEEPKYLRNRIRNELIPLLEDLVGGKSNLQVKMDSYVMFDFSF